MASMRTESEHYRSVIKHYDRLANHGPYGTLAPHNKGGRKSEYVAAVFDAALLPLIAGAGRKAYFLDFGCGTGIFTRKVAPYMQHVAGVDVSGKILEVACRVCADLSNVSLHLTDGERLPFEDCSFDWVAAREVLCCVPDDRLAVVLAEICRVLKPGGRFMLLEQVSDNPYWQYHPLSRSVKRAPATLRQFAEEAGFYIGDEFMVRTPRFPWIYPIWLGLVPRTFIPWLARLEVAWHRRSHIHPRRWWNMVFVLVKPQ